MLLIPSPLPNSSRDEGGGVAERSAVHAELSRTPGVSGLQISQSAFLAFCATASATSAAAAEGEPCTAINMPELAEISFRPRRRLLQPRRRSFDILPRDWRGFAPRRIAGWTVAGGRA